MLRLVSAALALGISITTAQVIKTTPTLQVVVNPNVLPSTVQGAGAYAALTSLSPEYPRFVPWYPYPRLVVAELEPPTNTSTSWNFTLIDPYVLDFLNATVGRKPIINFSTIPAWMFKTDAPVTYPDDPNVVDFGYTQGTELVDPTGQQIADYYERLVSWYTLGGFTDELGVHHTSGYHFDIPFWEVLNEVDAEHATTPEDYTFRYDAIVRGIRKASPKTQFVGLALAQASRLEYYEYFLNASNHQAGIPLDYISYHFYSTPGDGQTAEQWQTTFFSDGASFISTVQSIEAIRKSLSPATKTMINELGVILPNDNDPNRPPIPDNYWNVAGAFYAYLYVALAKLELEGTAGESQLVGYITQFPSVTEIDYNTGKPNARFRVLELLVNNVGPEDHIVQLSTPITLPDAVVNLTYTRHGVQKVILINEHLNATSVVVPGATGGGLQTVDLVSAGGAIRKEHLASDTVPLGGFAVVVVDMPH
ncbi:glycoside hydrolase superfamily [Mycena sp. CBHHK59/15]|nr:glycoside hydrolase superfamily [Mycena sp. CBHHK59/15]